MIKRQEPQRPGSLDRWVEQLCIAQLKIEDCSDHPLWLRCTRRQGFLMLFCDRLPDAIWAAAPHEERRREFADILTDFALSFPQLSYRPVLNTNLINAQAVTTAAGRYVNVYGGLVFHPGIGANSLVLALLHETGHHLSDGLRSPINRTIACECEADHWAIMDGAAWLARRSGRVFQLTVALNELSAIYSLAQTGNHTAAPARCWSCEWSARRQALLAKTPPSGGCYI
jgi:hypothetical protein